MTENDTDDKASFAEAMSIETVTWEPSEELVEYCRQRSESEHGSNHIKDHLVDFLNVEIDL